MYAHESGNGNRTTLEDSSAKLMRDNAGNAYAIAWGYTYQDGERLVYNYVVYGCREGWGTVHYATKGYQTLKFYWTRDGLKNGDRVARLICELSAGRSM